MKYKILFIDKKENYTNTDLQIFHKLQNIEMYFESTIKSIKEIFTTQDIHLIILNPDVLNFNLLNTTLKKISLVHDVPLLILNNLKLDIQDSHESLIIDYVDILNNSEILFNKIKFCYRLYKKELQHKKDLQRLLYIDTLTQLPNRAKLINDIQDDNIGITSLAVLDINEFKEINDFYGYQVGDKILNHIVSTIQIVTQRIENNVCLYKFSADVYCLSNTGLSRENFEEVIVYILGAVESEIFFVDEHEIDVRARAGITFSPKNNKLITASIALQVAKKSDKDYIIFYEELDNFKEYQNNMIWTKKLKNALEKDNIIVYFQPLVNNKTMKVDKYECLVRMIDEGKIITPFFFLEVSKRANQYRNITKIVIEKSFKKFEHLPFEFSINISYEDIEDKNFLNYIKYKLKEYGVAKRVVWEILEDESIKSYDTLLEFVKEVKSLGCKVAIDDFGSGYSNFEHLLKMDVDYLKIDASLVRYVVNDSNSYKVVKTIVDFANSLNLKTIAEYVENEEIFNIMKELGVDFSQGYHFSKPLPSPSISKY